MRVNLIVAYADKFVIGNDKNEIPWYYEEDLKRFQEITTTINNDDQTNVVKKKNVVLMGYKTQQSLPHNFLKNRFNIVITTKEGLVNDEDKNLVYTNSMGEAFEWCKENKSFIDKIFIIGGEQIYKYFMESYYVKHLDKVYITRIHKTIEGNKFKHFYGVGDTCYYRDIKKSETYPEIEYRTLQFDTDFKNPETKFLSYLQEMLKYGSYIKNVSCPFEKSKVDIIQHYNLKIELQCLLYFPLFGIMKKKKDSTIFKLLNIIQTHEIVKPSVEKIIEKIKNKRLYNMMINLTKDENFNSTYHFLLFEKQLICRVVQHRGNVVNNLIQNIVFSALLLFIIARTSNLVPAKIDFECIECYYPEKYNNSIEKMAWSDGTALPLLKISEREDFTPWNATVSDFKFLGLEV